MSAHSEGPWWETDGGVRNSGGYIVHTNSVQRYEGQDERYAFEVAKREADKRLITAAPDLLEACQAQHHAIDVLMARLIELDPEFRPTKSAMWPALVAGNAAIARATGETK